MMWMVITEQGALGQYDDYEEAYFAATINLGYEGWKIIKIY